MHAFEQVLEVVGWFTIIYFVAINALQIFIIINSVTRGFFGICPKHILEIFMGGIHAAINHCNDDIRTSFRDCACVVRRSSPAAH